MRHRQTQTDNWLGRHTQRAARLLRDSSKVDRDTTVRLGGTIRPAQRGPTGADHLAPHHIFSTPLRDAPPHTSLLRYVWDHPE